MIFNQDGIQALKSAPKLKIDLLLTDPPYDISSATDGYMYDPRRPNKRFDKTMNYGEWDHGFGPAWLKDILPLCTGWAVVFCGHHQISDYIRIMQSDGMTGVGMGVWEKNTGLPINAKHKFVNFIESFVYGKRPSSTWNSKHHRNILKTNSPLNKIHPTQKPVALFRRLIELTTLPGDLVVDPFAGSGTTGVACEQLDRRWLLYEKDEHHYWNAWKRLKQVQAQTKLVC